MVALTPDHERTEYVSLYNLVIPGGMFIGPIISGFLVDIPGGIVHGLRLAAVVGFVAALLVVFRGGCGARRQASRCLR